MTEVIVFKTSQHTWCVPTAQVYIRRGAANNNFGLRFVADTHGGSKVGETSCVDIDKDKFRIYASMQEAMADDFYWT